MPSNGLALGEALAGAGSLDTAAADTEAGGSGNGAATESPGDPADGASTAGGGC
jgi:hypothetical protein